MRRAGSSTRRAPASSSRWASPASSGDTCAVAEADDHLVERLIEGEQVFQGHFLDVRRDRVTLPDGRTAHREYIRHPGAVMVVPLLDDGRLLMERQYRYPMGRVMLEFPAGKLDAGEAPLVCGQRELLEETGYRAAEWAYAGVLHNAIAYSDEGIHIYFARGLTRGEQQLDDGEFLELVTHTVDEVDRMAARGELTDAKTLIGLLWLQRWQQGAWALDWQPA
ncbi:NUDIX domain-containing protein [Roseateles sp. DXS20W]|uniref:GDP-mannose pyrophosphatase n=1 Tax=Pelomonas lactea TaxID=3299030 RepID=A0ABW7GH17_9BURK